MDADQFRIFRDITLNYFGKMAPREEPPTMEDAFMLFGEPVLLDYASVVSISGPYSGSLYLTSNAHTLGRLLALYGETRRDPDALSDMCRELSNVLSGNASHAFGTGWKISVPTSIEPGQRPDLPMTSYVWPFAWLGDRSFLVVGLQEASP
ncbi:MAG: chemotaxis protein CheX [Verrucomicrobiales bacterium]